MSTTCRLHNGKKNLNIEEGERLLRYPLNKTNSTLSPPTNRKGECFNEDCTKAGWITSFSIKIC